MRNKFIATKQQLRQQNMKAQIKMNSKPGLVGQLHRRNK